MPLKLEGSFLRTQFVVILNLEFHFNRLLCERTTWTVLVEQLGSFQVNTSPTVVIYSQGSLENWGFV